jgi:flavin-dependent dehydrogenase
VVLERDRYPRDKPCAGAIGARADRALGAIGVHVDVPSVPIDGIEVRTSAGVARATRRGAGRVVRRVEFDHALARITASRGIVVRDGVRVLSVHPTTRGVTVRTNDGDIVADVVVGADGVGGICRRALGVAETPHRAQAIEVDTERVASDLPPRTVFFDLSRRDLPGYYWEFETLVNGRSLVSRGVYYLKTANLARPLEIEAVLSEELARRGLSLGAHRKKRYAERGFHASGAMARGRVLLVGEAAGIDPVTGEGIAQAIQYGQAAGPYLARKLSEGDLQFADWPRAIRRASIGRDLLVRSAALRLAYGTWRPTVERFLIETPHFAGGRYRRADVLSVLRDAGRTLIAKAQRFPGRDGLSTTAGTELP